uniref:Uncharacterized protein n=1 Tax=Ixodes scapularis TaxID=6945 RepID=A0A4D5RG84_IXOSC
MCTLFPRRFYWWPQAFLGACASRLSAASLAFLARRPQRRALALAWRRCTYASYFFSSSVGTRGFSKCRTLRRGITTPLSCVASFCSSSEASALAGLAALRGNRMSLDLYSLSRCTFCCRLSTLLLRRR